MEESKFYLEKREPAHFTLDRWGDAANGFDPTGTPTPTDKSH